MVCVCGTFALKKKSRLRDEVRISHGRHVKLIHTVCQARSQNLILKF